MSVQRDEESEPNPLKMVTNYFYDNRELDQQRERNKPQLGDKPEDRTQGHFREARDRRQQ